MRTNLQTYCTQSLLLDNETEMTQEGHANGPKYSAGRGLFEEANPVAGNPKNALQFLSSS